MKRAWVGCVMILAMVSLSATAAPRIAVDSDTYDFGTVVEGFAIKHTFVLTNTGDTTLVIDRVRTTCGCTTTMELPTNELRPGQSVELKAEVGSTGFGGQQISKAIYIYSNDPRYSDGIGPDKLVVVITGTVVRAQPYHVTPEDFYLDSYLLVDVRSAAEYATGHLFGAVNIGPSELGGTLAAIEIPESMAIFIYDETGFGAKAVADGLASAGLLAFSVNGGLAQWVLEYGDTYIVPRNAELVLDAPIMVPDRTTNVIPTSYLRSSLYLLVDLRGAQAFAAGHLAGAANVPGEAFSLAALREAVGALPIDARIVLYDATGQTSDTAAQTLIRTGYTNTRSLLGGFEYWVQAYGSQMVW